MTFVRRVDTLMTRLADLFLVAANLCLFAMLAATAATIILRPLGLSFYWLWPWSMQVFVWMSFLGFFTVYQRRKDIAVDFVMRKLGPRAMKASRWFVAGLVAAVMIVLLVEAPKILKSQVGVIDGVVTPWGGELERWTLSVPLFVSCALILLNALLDMAKSWLGLPEPVAEHHVGDE
ncbi:MAG: TRAP transporter small permease [Geminicoccaceae bacterium]|nr:TRAP transporter small permease [Geminicoccaceae bacterium]